MVGRLWLKGLPEPPCPHKVSKRHQQLKEAHCSWEMHAPKEAKCTWCKERLFQRGYFCLSYDALVEPEMDRWSLDVEEGKCQECVAGGWHQDGPEEGQVLLAAWQTLCTICGTRLKHQNINAVLDSCSPFHLIQHSPFFALFQISNNKP